jgi:Spy/CpxP family protein refolding chaperone
MKKMIIALSAGVLATVVSGARAEDTKPATPPPAAAHEGRHPGMKAPGMDMGKELGLTEEQQKKIEEIRKSHADEMAATRKAVKDARDSKDEAAAKTAMEAAKALHEKVKAECDAVLTAEQKAKMDELRKARDAKMKERGEKRGGDRKGGKGGPQEGDKPQPPPPPAAE